MHPERTNTSIQTTRHALTKWSVVGVVFVVIASAFALAIWCGHERRSLVSYVEQRGGHVTMRPLSPRWLNAVVPAPVADSVTDITTVTLQDASVNDAVIARLTSLGSSELQSLERLNLENTRVTDASLQHLSGLANLKRLVLENTDVTDAGLAYVSVLTSLEGLNLEQTQVSDLGLSRLKTLKHLRELSLNKTQVSDAGLRHIWVHTGLTGLDLRNTKVTEAGVAELQLHLPTCKVLH